MKAHTNRFRRLPFLVFFFYATFLLSCESDLLTEIQEEVAAATMTLDPPVTTVNSPTTNKRPTWSWQIPTGATEIRIQLDGEEQQSWSFFGGTHITSFTPEFDLPDGRYTLYVQAKSSVNWSASGYAEVIIDTSGPEIDAGSDIAWTKEEQVLAGSAADATPLTYMWEKLSGAGTLSFGTRTALTTTVEGEIGEEQSFIIRFTATDELGHISSDTLVLNWDSKAPDPGDQGAITITTIESQSLTLVWLEADDISTLKNNIEYRVLGSTNNNIGSANDVNAIGDGRFVISDWTAGIGNVNVTQLETGSYYFNVFARDAMANISSYYQVCAVPDTPPDFEAIGDVGQITLTWTDNTAIETGYKLERSEGDDQHYLVIANALPVNTTTYIDNTVTTGVTYFYRLEVVGAFGQSVYTDQTHAAAVSPDPPVVSGVSPTIDFTPTWNWTIPDSAVNIRYQLDSENTDGWTTTDGIDITSFTPGAILTEDVHTLYVQAGDAGGGWSNSGSRIIQVDLQPPEAPNPEDGATSPDFTPLLDWADHTGAVRYDLQISESNESWESVDVIDCGSNAEYQLESELGIDTTWYWRLRCENDDMLQTEWSESWRFTVSFSVGDSGPAGGVVFYDKGSYSEGWRFLETPPIDQGGAVWGSFETDIFGADGTAIGTGAQNTAEIIAVQGSGSNTAAQICDGLSFGGYDDWFLPSRDELNQIYLQRGVMSELVLESYYWSSSEAYSTHSYIQWFGDDGTGSGPSSKNLGYRVRAVRVF